MDAAPYEAGHRIGDRHASTIEPPAEESVRYDRERCDARSGSCQRLLRDRFVLRPEIDLNLYKCSASFDWVQLHLPVDKGWNQINLQKVANAFLRRIDSPSTVFCNRYWHGGYWLRIQDPQPHELPQLTEHLRKRLCFDISPAEIPILGLELSIDFRIIGAHKVNESELNSMRSRILDVLRSHCLVQIGDAPKAQPRFFVHGSHRRSQRTVDHYKGTDMEVRSHLARLGIGAMRSHLFSRRAYHKPAVDTTLYIGEENTQGVLYRSMDKVSDRRNPSKDEATLLPLHDRRARLEISLPATKDRPPLAHEIGLGQLRDLYTSDYHRLRTVLFDFFLPTIRDGDLTDILPFPTDVNEQFAFDKAGVYGLDRFQRIVNDIHRARWERKQVAVPLHPLGSKGYLLSYSDLNQKVFRALKALSAEWQQCGSWPE